MTIDIGAILDGVTPLVGSVLDTMGTTVDLYHNRNLYDDATMDPVTLKLIDPTPDLPYETGVSALVQAAGDTQRTRAPLTSQVASDFIVKISADFTDVTEQDIIEVTDSRDTTLIGARLRVLAVGSDGAGLLRVLRTIVDVQPTLTGNG